MKWTIIVLIMMSLIGSMMWVMPTPRQRFQSKLRLDARKYGFQVQLSHLTLPRAKGEVEPETVSIPAYRLLRGDSVDRKERDLWIEWKVARVEALANEGLPKGWAWIKGERTLSNRQLTWLSSALEAFPEEVVAVESSALHIMLYWREPEREGALDELHTHANQFIQEVI